MFTTPIRTEINCTRLMVSPIETRGPTPRLIPPLPAPIPNTRAPTIRQTTPRTPAIHGPINAPSNPVADTSASYEAPSDPNEIDQLCPSEVRITACGAAKPIDTRIGATTATGTP